MSAKPILTLLPVLLLAVGSLMPDAARAREPLSRESHVNQSLISARVADRIRRECPSIRANMVRAFAAAQQLKAYAQRQGYSEAEIDDFLSSKAERARIYAEAESYMGARGVRAGDADSFCRLGHAEIDAGTLIGYLISRR